MVAAVAAGQPRQINMAKSDVAKGWRKQQIAAKEKWRAEEHAKREARKIRFQYHGISFPLFDAPVPLAPDYVGHRYCELCNINKDNCFSFGIGTRVSVTCAQCSEENPVSGEAAKSTPCKRCGSSLPISSHDSTTACFDCFRQGRATTVQDTELGMLTPDDVDILQASGSSSSRYKPLLNRLIASTKRMIRGSTVPDHEPANYWRSKGIAVEDLVELTRTPNYLTWQGERWLFCCQKPMRYLGELDEDLAKHHDTIRADGEFAKEILGPHEGEYFDVGMFGGPVIYVFECQNCGKKRAHYDID